MVPEGANDVGLQGVIPAIEAITSILECAGGLICSYFGGGLTSDVTNGVDVICGDDVEIGLRGVASTRVGLCADAVVALAATSSMVASIRDCSNMALSLETMLDSPEELILVGVISFGGL